MKDDTISRAAALAVVEKMYKLCEGNLSDYHDLLVACITDLTPAQRWIKVTPKTLPKKVGDYLVTTHSGQIARYIYMGNGTSKEYWMRCVLAWMPLPAPYRPEGEEHERIN